MPYLSALEVCSRRGAIQIHVYLYLLPYLSVVRIATNCLVEKVAEPASRTLSVSYRQNRHSGHVEVRGGQPTHDVSVQDLSHSVVMSCH